MALKQDSRLVQITSPLGDNVLHLQKMHGHDELGRLFEYELDLISENPAIDLDKVLGKPMTVTLALHDGSKRYFHGIVARFGQTAGNGQFSGYRATLRPWFWLLSRSSDCRIFQNKTAPDIIKEIFRDHGFSDFEESLSGNYRTWEYSVQYRETSFDFVSRLMEQEGIYYYFRHEKDKHVLVLSDAYGSHHPVSGYATVPYYPPTEQQRERDHIYDWHIAREVQSGSLALNDYDFQRPSARLEVRSVVPRQHAQAEHKLYDYPGEYVQSSEGEHYARARIEALHTQFERVELRGKARGLGSGHLFKLSGYPRDDQNREYLIVSSRYRIANDPYESDGMLDEVQFESALSCIESRQAYRSLPLTPKPIVQGPQTAKIVGPSGEEIWTDQYGRVKVHFYWDRHDKSDENSSCWMRVSQSWAGKSWGTIHIPRIGQEVIVSFLEGDPDRPIITGRVYNAEQTVPYALPDQKVVSGAKSQTHKGQGYNELSMDDTAGKEKITIHAQFDMNTTVEHDQTDIVHNNRTTTVDVDDKLTVSNNRTMDIAVNLSESTGANYTESVGGNSDTSITGNHTQKVTGTSTTTVTGAFKKTGESTLDIHATDPGTYTSDSKLTFGVAGSTIVITSTEIKLSIGASSITLNPMGVSVMAPKISLNG